MLAIDAFQLAGDQFKKVSDFERRVNVSIVRSLSERDDMKFG